MEEIKNSLIDLENGIYKIDTDRTMSLLESILNNEFNGEINDVILEAKDTLEIMLIWHNSHIKRLNEYYFGKTKCGNCTEKDFGRELIMRVIDQYKKGE